MTVIFFAGVVLSAVGVYVLTRIDKVRAELEADARLSVEKKAPAVTRSSSVKKSKGANAENKQTGLSGILHT